MRWTVKRLVQPGDKRTKTVFAIWPTRMTMPETDMVWLEWYTAHQHRYAGSWGDGPGWTTDETEAII